MTASLASICISAFLSVFLLLAILAITMRVILALFPCKETSSDTTIIAAITTTFDTLYPGEKISKIEEIK